MMKRQVSEVEINLINNMENSNKQIAKNALALYFRMIITMIVGLYTSRIILQALGIEDFGIYNVIGGFVSMFALISGALQSSISRFITYELGRGDKKQLSVVFSTSTYVIIGICILVVIATETVGMWYINNIMVLPSNRLIAANWVFQFSVVSFVLTIINTTYQSSILSHEKMEIYAYISIFDAFAKLGICYLVILSSVDKLVCYSALLCLVSLIDQLVSVVYCKRKFEECNLQFIFDRSLFKKIFGFAGWSFVGSSATILRNQGANLILNIFGGPIINAANGIANNVSNIVLGFVSNFTMAFNPQIVKRYASGEYNSLYGLIVSSAKYSYYLMYVISLPIIINTHLILNVWLGEIPNYTVQFTRWMFLMLLAETVTRPLITLKGANGNIRNYQLVVGGILLMMLPISYIALRMGCSVIIVAITNGITGVFAAIARILMLKDIFPGWSTIRFIRDVIIRIILVTVITIIPIGWLATFVHDEVYRFCITVPLSFVSTIFAILSIGCTNEERKLFKEKIVDYISKRISKL